MKNGQRILTYSQSYRKYGFTIHYQTAISSLKKGELILREGHFLNDALVELPNGIIKKITNIGLTTCELTAPRHSIIVVPFKALAYQKERQDDLVVASGMEDRIKRYRDGGISKYDMNEDIKVKKILVTPESFMKVIEELGEPVYKKYFILIDEIDLFQSEMDYRGDLEPVIDEYFKFENRALTSATLRDFSHPDLKLEDKCFIGREGEKKVKINIRETKEPVISLKNRIIELQQQREKVFIALNDINMARASIHLLGSHSDCKIMCSDQNEKKDELLREHLYGELISAKLPTKFTFATASYYSGVDFDERVHIILVVDHRKSHTLLSIEKIKQILGRPRSGIIDVTLIVKLGKSEERNPSLGDLENAQNVLGWYRQMIAFEIPAVSLTKIQEGLCHELPLRLDKDHQVQESYLQIDFEKIKKEVAKLYESKEHTLDGLNQFNPQYCFDKVDQEDLNLLKRYYAVKTDQFQVAKKEFLLEKRTGRKQSIPLKYRRKFDTAFDVILKVTGDEDLTCYLFDKFINKKMQNSLNKLIAQVRFFKLIKRKREKVLCKFKIGETYNREEIQEIFDKTSVQSILQEIEVDSSKIVVGKLLKYFFETRETSKVRNGSKENQIRIIDRHYAKQFSKPRRQQFGFDDDCIFDR